jgi:cullin 3
LAKQTATKLKAVVDHEYITVHSKYLVEMEGSGVSLLLENDSMDDLRRLYTLFARVPHTLDLIRDALGTRVSYLIYDQ